MRLRPPSRTTDTQGLSTSGKGMGSRAAASRLASDTCSGTNRPSSPAAWRIDFLSETCSNVSASENGNKTSPSSGLRGSSTRSEASVTGISASIDLSLTHSSTASAKASGSSSGSGTGWSSRTQRDAPANDLPEVETTSTSCPARPSDRTIASAERCSPSVTRTRSRCTHSPGTWRFRRSRRPESADQP